jgi:hypothetical protein
MARIRSTPADLPRWLVVAGSILIVCHLIAVASAVLATVSGPWVTFEGPSLSPPPSFARAINDVSGRYYLKNLKLGDNYHFASNAPGPPGVFVEVRLKDASGQLLKTIRIPDARTNPSVRYWQALVVQGLAPDQLVPPPAGESVAAPRKTLETIPIWDPGEGGTLTIHRVPEHLIPRDRPAVYRPTEWSLVLARSISRYLCRVHGAASAEFLRHTRESYHPALWFMEDVQPGAFNELVASYGEMPK